MSVSLRQWRAELDEAVRFLTRVPFRGTAVGGEPPRLGIALRWAPLIGALVSIGPSATLGACHLCDIGSLPSALVAVLVALGLTGALHEDGLADVADGFGGGATRERKLEIMRDSRIGSFGALALAGSLALRAACLASLLDRQGLAPTVAAVAIAAIVSRALMLVPLATLPPARRDGLAHGAGLVAPRDIAAALLIGAALAASAALAGGTGLLRLAGSAVFAAGLTLALRVLARRQIGGVTGDVAGATQQVSEMALLIGLSGAPALL